MNKYTVKPSATTFGWVNFDAPDDTAAVLHMRDYYPEATLLYRYSAKRGRYYQVKFKGDVE